MIVAPRSSSPSSRMPGLDVAPRGDRPRPRAGRGVIGALPDGPPRHFCSPAVAASRPQRVHLEGVAAERRGDVGSRAGRRAARHRRAELVERLAHRRRGVAVHDRDAAAAAPRRAPPRSARARTPFPTRVSIVCTSAPHALGDLARAGGRTGRRPARARGRPGSMSETRAASMPARDGAVDEQGRLVARSGRPRGRAPSSRSCSRSSPGRTGRRAAPTSPGARAGRR